MNRLRLMLLCILACLGPAAAAEAEPPPARVGQISLVSGTAQMRLDAGGDWLPAELNTPLTAGVSLATEGGSRVEVRIGSTALRMAQGGRVRLTELNDTGIEAELQRGTLALRVRSLPPGEQITITAGGSRVVALAPGAYRASYVVRERRFTVHVMEGQARLVLNQQEMVLSANQRAVADTERQILLEQGPGAARSALDEFADSRDRRSEQSAALQHLPAEMTGAEALDGYGDWRIEPGQGPVWYPDRLPPDWAPYRFGRWRWMPPWGWTWLDDARWGFAPFHYGRWLFLGGRWGWVPGQETGNAGLSRPVYAPALVGFYGQAGEASWSPAASGPPVVGWYPLAPGEVYWPAYSSHLPYVRALNAPSVNNVSAIRAFPDAVAAGPAHRFARTAFAATAVPQSAFMDTQPVAANQVAMPPATLAMAPLSGRRAPPARAPAAARPPSRDDDAPGGRSAQVGVAAGAGPAATDAAPATTEPKRNRIGGARVTPARALPPAAAKRREEAAARRAAKAAGPAPRRAPRRAQP